MKQTNTQKKYVEFFELIIVEMKEKKKYSRVKKHNNPFELRYYLNFNKIEMKIIYKVFFIRVILKTLVFIKLDRYSINLDQPII
jgi:hypothetical protein